MPVDKAYIESAIKSNVRVAVEQAIDQAVEDAAKQVEKAVREQLGTIVLSVFDFYSVTELQNKLVIEVCNKLKVDEECSTV